MGLDKYGLSKEILDALSYETQMGKNLRNTTLRRIDKEKLFVEIENVIDFYMGNELFDEADFSDVDYRIKSMDSCERKYERYYPNREINKVYNDILGFRIIVSNYEDILSLDLSLFDVVDMSKGKANDDGYRGIHLYYKKSNYHYPIEIQINTEKDRQFADWSHICTYKQGYNNNVSLYLRKEYDDGKIKSIEDFEEVLSHVLSGSKEIR